MENTLKWGQILKRERLLRGLAQSDIAERCGCDVKTVGRWERDSTYPSPYYIQKLIKIFNKNAEELGLVDKEDAYNSSPRRSLARRETSGNENALLTREDWSDAPAYSQQVYGRTEALSMVAQRVMDEESSVIAILGLGGIGKTTFVRQLAEQVKGQFDYVFWRSLKNTPPVEEILNACLRFLLSRPLSSHLSFEERLSLLITTLQRHRCLLIIDNVESILQIEQQNGDYIEVYKGYGELFRRIAEARHPSCLLLTSREKPGELARLEVDASSIHFYTLQGIDVQGSQKLLKKKQLQGSDEAWRSLIHHYAGNPLILKLIASSIKDHFNGDIDVFLKEGETVFGDIRQLLALQFQRASELEKATLLWLAIEREAVPRGTIREDSIQPLPKGALTEAIDSLLRRSLVETTAENRLTLQPVVMEYLSSYLLEAMYQEIIAGTDAITLFSTHALMKAQSSDYIRASQARLFLIPLIERLLATCGQEEAEQRLKALLATLTHHPFLASSYAAGNILNLLLYMNADLRGLNCSHLTIRQAVLRGAELPFVSFHQAIFKVCIFTDTFTSILGMAVSRDGQLLAAGTTTGEIRLWRVSDASPFMSCTGHTDGVRAIAFSSDGKLFASASEDYMVGLWETRTGLCRYMLQGHSAWVRTVAFHPQTMLLASGGDDGTVRIWDVQTGIMQQLLQRHHAPVRTLVFHPLDARLVSGDDNGTVCIWDIATGICVKTLQAHEQAVRCLTFNTDGSILATGSEDQLVRLWQFASWKKLATLRGHTDRIRSLAFRDDSLVLASGGDDSMIYLWDVQEKLNTRIIQGHTNRIWSLAFVPKSNTLISASEDDTLCWWQTDTGDCIRNLHGYTDLIKSVAWSPDSVMLVSGSEDETVRLWDTTSGRCTRVLQGHSNRVRTVAWSVDGTTVASGSEDETVRLWNAHTGQVLQVLRGHKHLIRCVAFSPDGRLLISSSYDGTVRLWDVESRYYRYVMDAEQRAVLTVAFSPDGRWFVSGGEDSSVRVWNVETGELVRVLVGHTRSVWSIAWSKDGRYIASGGDDGTVRLWNAHTGETHLVLEGHTSQIRAVDFHPEGYMLASGAHDFTVRLWNVETGQRVRTLAGHEGWIGTVAFSPDGRCLASGSDDSTIRIWSVESGECIRLVKREGPYENMDITEAQGLSESQKTSLRHLGAIDKV